MMDELTDWIRSTRYRIPVREPEGGEIVRILPVAPGTHNWFPFVTDEATGEAVRVSHIVVLRTRGEFLGCYQQMIFAPFIAKMGELALWPVRSDDIAQAIEGAPDGWVRVLNPRSASLSFRVLSDTDLPEPVWPDLNWEEIADLGLGGRLVYKLDDPLIRRAHEQVLQSPQASHE
jgi:hypothetical protein